MTETENLPESDAVTRQIWEKEDLLSYVMKDLDLRVKHDLTTKRSALSTGLSAFTNSPMNTFFNGPSGIGKTFNTIQSLKYWPKDMVWLLAGLSRKSLQHDYGILKNANGEPIDMDDWPLKPRSRDYETPESFKEAMTAYHNDLKAKKEELKDSYMEVNLWHKILVFLEAPDYQTCMDLKPILSHDTEEITYRFVDKSAKSGPMRTVVVKVVGWPATIFLSTSLRYIEEMATRGFTATPEDNPKKFEAANILTMDKVSEPWEFSKDTDAMKTIKELIRRLKLTVDVAQKPLSVVLPFKNLQDLFPHEIPRDMRDFQHFTQLTQALTVLYYFQRPSMKVNGDEWLLATAEDVRVSYEIYKAVFETTRTGLDKRVLDFYWKVAVKHEEGTYLSALTDEYIKLTKRTLSSRSIDRFCDKLEEAGYMDRRADPEGKKNRNFYVPLKFKAEKLANTDKSLLSNEFMSILEKGFDSWLISVGQKPTFYKSKIAESQTTIEQQGLNHAELKEIIIKNNFVVKSPAFCQTDEKPKTTSETAIEAVSPDKHDLSTFASSKSDYVR